MYRMGLLSDLPQKDVGRLIALTVVAGFFGVFFVVPLRKYYIVHQKLTFPTPAATVGSKRVSHLSHVQTSCSTGVHYSFSSQQQNWCHHGQKEIFGPTLRLCCRFLL